MPTVSKQQAVEVLTHAIEEARADDLVEIYNELFPGEPTSEEAAPENGTPLMEQVVGHIHKGLEIEEIVDLWNVIFPKHRDVHYDEETGAISYSEGSEPLQYVE